jgi:hypothetical protein
VGTSCGFEACESNWGDCDGDISNGCESNLRLNGNCGACGVTCSGGTPNCCSGACSGDSCVIP